MKETVSVHEEFSVPLKTFIEKFDIKGNTDWSLWVGIHYDAEYQKENIEFSTQIVKGTNPKTIEIIKYELPLIQILEKLDIQRNPNNIITIRQDGDNLIIKLKISDGDRIVLSKVESNG